MDAAFVKRSAGREVRPDREDAREAWESAASGFADLERGGLQGRSATCRGYIDAAELGYTGMVPCDLAGDEDTRADA